MLQTVLMLIALVVMVYLGFKFYRRIPKGGAHRPKKHKAKQRKQEPTNPQGAPPVAEESKDWFSATFGGGLSQFPGLNVIFEAAQHGDPNAIGMAQVFAAMVDNGGKLQLLEKMDSLATRMFDNGATPDQVSRALDSLVSATRSSYQTPSRTPTFTVGPRGDRFGVKEARRRNGR